MVFNITTITDPQTIVESFVDYFSQSFGRTPSVDIPSAPYSYNVLSLTSVTYDDVLKALKRLKPAPHYADTYAHVRESAACVDICQS
jgi:hypothetical protein